MSISYHTHTHTHTHTHIHTHNECICINSLSHGDDMVVVAPTLDALQDLINVCQMYADKHDTITAITKHIVAPHHHHLTLQ